MARNGQESINKPERDLYPHDAEFYDQVGVGCETLKERPLTSAMFRDIGVMVTA